MMISRTLGLWAWGVLTVLFYGCGGGSSDPSSGMNLGREKTMILHLLNDIGGMNPYTTVGADAHSIHNLVFDRLVVLDFDKLDLRPGLATALPEISEDRMVYTFSLNPKATFSDGTPLTAQDVVFSFKAIMNPFVDSAPRRAELHNYIDCVAMDEHTVRLLLKDSGPFNLGRLAVNFHVLPKHVYDPQSLTDAYTGRDATLAEESLSNVTTEVQEKLRAFAETFEDEKYQREKGFVVGSGRYRFDGWTTGQLIRLVKNEKYWNQGSPSAFAMQGMDTLVYKTIPDMETALTALKAGEIDFSDRFEPAQFKEKMSGEDFEANFEKKLINYPYYEYIGWNTRIRNNPARSFFADQRVRLAMSHLVDVEEIIENVMYGTAVPITSMTYRERPEYNDQLQAIPYNEEKAKALLYQAGWEDSNGDGILDKNIQGQLVNFSFSLYYRQGNNVRQSIARIVQDKLKKVGIEMDVKALDWTVMIERLKKKELDAWIGAWVYDSDEQDYYSLFHSSQILNDGYNWTGYSNPEADRIMQKITVTWDQTERYALHKRIQEILYEDQPYTLLFGNAARIGYNQRLTTDKWYGQRPCYDPGQFYLAGGKSAQ